MTLGHAELVRRAQKTWMGGHCGATLHSVGPVEMAVDRSEIAESGWGHLCLVDSIPVLESAKRNRRAGLNWTARAAGLKDLEQDWLE